MSIKSELSVLKVNIQNAKDKLYTNLVDKGVTDITTASTLDVMADSVSDIVTGTSSGSDNIFEAIGYEATPQYIQAGIDYSKTIYDNWNASITSCNEKFKEDKQLMYFPLVDTSNVTTMASMFSSCTNLQYVPPIDTSNVTTMASMFYYCITLPYVPPIDTSNVTDMSTMFYNCSVLTSLVLSSFDTSKVTKMGHMFYGCSGLTSLDLSSFNTSNVSTMIRMFSNCYNLTSLDLSSFHTSSVTDMSYMFYTCSGLTSLDLSSFNTSNVSSMSNMFNYCNNLQRIDGYLDWSKISSYPSSFITSNGTYGYPLRYMRIKNLGKTGTTFNFNNNNIQNWGDETDTSTYPLSIGARQSLVDSLLTYSFDRATNGLSTCTIQLQSKVKARLTSDEIAAITAKGFTIA